MLVKVDHEERSLRARSFGEMIAHQDMTVRAVGNRLNASKSTVHKEVISFLPEIDVELGREAKGALLRHRRRIYVVGELKVFRFKVEVGGEDVPVYVSGKDIEEAAGKVWSAGLRMRRVSIVELPACSLMRINCHGELFCGDGDDDHIGKCRFDGGTVFEECPRACTEFWDLIADPGKREFRPVPGGMRLKRLRDEFSEVSG